MKIALTVSYALDVDDRLDFYDSKTHRLLDSINEELSVRFPKEITLSENVKGVKNSLEYIPMIENKNYVRCDFCGKYLSISNLPYFGLDSPTKIKGKNLCELCKWELEDEL